MLALAQVFSVTNYDVRKRGAAHAQLKNACAQEKLRRASLGVCEGCATEITALLPPLAVARRYCAALIREWLQTRRRAAPLACAEAPPPPRRSSLRYSSRPRRAPQQR